jgi:hypothetical protein
MQRDISMYIFSLHHYDGDVIVTTSVEDDQEGRE